MLTLKGVDCIHYLSYSISRNIHCDPILLSKSIKECILDFIRFYKNQFVSKKNVGINLIMFRQ